MKTTAPRTVSRITNLTRALAAAVLALAAAAGPSARAAEGPSSTEGLFPFSLPIDDVTEGVTDLSFMNPRPADELVSVADGHFQAGGRRIRFWATLITGASCFPPHDEAELLARRLAGMGFNLIRIHLIDCNYAPNGILDPAYKGQLRLEPGQLDKLDYFIAQLKRRGLYVELPINGQHWRNITGPAQFAGMESTRFASFSSGVPLWNASFIAAEQQWARAFFGHVNPYTGHAYTAEPSVATMEIVNENGIICGWRGGHFRKAWPPAMIADLQTHWNAFLKSRYHTSQRLRQAWAAGATRVKAVEMLGKSWSLQVVKPSTATQEALAHGGPDGRPGLLLTSDHAAQNLAFVLLYQKGLAMEKGCRYRLSFWAKADLQAADTPLQIQATVSLDHAPWHNLGLARPVEIDKTWREVSLVFEGAADEPQAKLMLAPPLGASRITLAGLSLHKADITGLPPEEALDAGNVSMPLTPEDCLERTPAVAVDFVDFLYDVDQRYFQTMRDFLRQELHCKHPLKGTQVDRYSSYFSQSQTDFIDCHGYWQHPSFPRKPWDPKDWTIGNSPMVNHGGEVPVDLAGCRVHGLPYNVSEYCHPAPSTYCAEEVPTVAAMGALQDWDGITFHCWNEWTYDWRRRQVVKLPADRLENYFNHARHTVKRVTLPFGALVFRRPDVAPARQELSIGITLAGEKQWLIDQPRRSQGWRSYRAASLAGAGWIDAFSHRLSLDLAAPTTAHFAPPEARQANSDTGELFYDQADPVAGVLTINAPRAKAVIGFGAGRTFELGDVTVRPGPTLQRGFAVITASAVRGDDFHSPGGKLLITATGAVENQGMVWNADRTSVGNQWGPGPVLCEGIPFDLALQTRQAEAWALDGHGRRLARIPAEPAASGVRFTFGPRYKTLWYEIATQ